MKPEFSSFSIFIRVTGPKTILKETLEKVPCDINDTWFNFLKKNCKLVMDINPNSALVIKTAKTFCGWEAKLGDTIRDFLKKYSYVRHTYTIRLALSKKPRKTDAGGGQSSAPVSRKSESSVTGLPPMMTRRQRAKSLSNNANELKLPKPSQIVPIVASTSNSHVPEVSKVPSINCIHPPLKKRKIVIVPNSPILWRHHQPTERESQEQNVRLEPTRGENSNFTSKNMESINRPLQVLQPESLTFVEASSPTQWPEDELYNDNNNPNENYNNGCFRIDNEDALSQITSASVEDQELVNEGITNNEIKPRVITRLIRNFDNATMLRIQHELRTLVGNGNRSWYRLTSRAPRTAHLLQDVFQIFSSERP